MVKNSPIGLFDSGIGGLNIWKEIKNILPNESTVYLADMKNAPYGDKSRQHIIDCSIKNTEYLIQKQCKIIIVACNTATTNAIEILRSKFDIPFIGIEPAIKPATLISKTRVIGVLATKRTLVSSLFYKTHEKIGAERGNIKIIQKNGLNLVEMIETGDLKSDKLFKLLTEYLTPMLEKGIDALVLGCTHYPYLEPLIRKILPKEIHIIDSGYAVAKQTKKVLQNQGLIIDYPIQPKYKFIGNTSVDIMNEILKMMGINQKAHIKCF